VSLPEDFADEAMYGPEGWYVHRLLGVDKEARQVVAEIDTTRIDWLVGAQREVSGHQKHIPAAVVIQATGTLGQLYAVYALGLRATEGWAGYGTHIRQARFGRMGLIGPPVVATVTCTKQRQILGTWFCDFDFRFEQEREVVYASVQTAAWRRQAPVDG
jgi:hypothetical protein